MLMKSLSLGFLCLVVVALSSCNQSPKAAQFQLTPGPDGKVFRLNSETGETYLVTDSGLVELSDAAPVLRVGEYYEMADASTNEKFLKYLGQGKFEQSAWAIKQLDKK
jgi:hypothetical protein